MAEVIKKNFIRNKTEEAPVQEVTYMQARTAWAMLVREYGTAKAELALQRWIIAKDDFEPFKTISLGTYLYGDMDAKMGIIMSPYWLPLLKAHFIREKEST